MSLKFLLRRSKRLVTIWKTAAKNSSWSTFQKRSSKSYLGKITPRINLKPNNNFNPINQNLLPQKIFTAWHIRSCMVNPICRWAIQPRYFNKNPISCRAFKAPHLKGKLNLWPHNPNRAGLLDVAWVQGGLNQPAPSRSPQNTMKNQIFFLIFWKFIMN